MLTKSDVFQKLSCAITDYVSPHTVYCHVNNENGHVTTVLSSGHSS